MLRRTRGESATVRGRGVMESAFHTRGARRAGVAALPVGAARRRRGGEG